MIVVRDDAGADLLVLAFRDFTNRCGATIAHTRGVLLGAIIDVLGHRGGDRSFAERPRAAIGVSGRGGALIRAAECAAEQCAADWDDRAQSQADAAGI